jgi:hypothetical protein
LVYIKLNLVNKNTFFLDKKEEILSINNDRSNEEPQTDKVTKMEEVEDLNIDREDNCKKSRKLEKKKNRKNLVSKTKLRGVANLQKIPITNPKKRWEHLWRIGTQIKISSGDMEIPINSLIH